MAVPFFCQASLMFCRRSDPAARRPVNLPRLSLLIIAISIASQSTFAADEKKTAAAQTGDLEGFSPAVNVGAKGLTVVIDRAVP